MDIKNIKGIIGDKLWQKIKKNKGYRGYTIIDADCKPSVKRQHGFYFVLMIFFTNKTKKSTIENYHKEGCRVKKRGSHEQLDSNYNCKFYGNMQTLTFS